MIEETLAFGLLKLVKSSRPVIWPVLDSLGLHPGQDLLLSELWREDGISQAELVARLGVEPPTVSNSVQRLERAGYLRREPGPGRTRLVFLTQAGRDLREPVEHAWAEADRRLVGPLSDAEQDTLVQTVRRMRGLS